VSGEPPPPPTTFVSRKPKTATATITPPQTYIDFRMCGV
jgi:hypothetical protein